MKSIYQDIPAPEVPVLALPPKKAAVALSVSERTLWGLTSPRGPITCFRIGSKVLYSVETLKDYVRKTQEQTEAANGEGASDA